MSSIGMTSLVSSAANEKLGLTERTANLKLSCNIYSFNHLLTERIMSLEEVIDFCAELGFQAVDPTGYYFTGYPQVPADDYIYSIKHRAFVNGMSISGTGIRTNFAHPDKAERQKNIELTRKWVEMAAKLDAPTLRVFAGNERPDGYELAEIQEWIIEALDECVAFGADHGVMITLQNHYDVLKTVEEVRFVLDAISSPWLGLNLDIGSLRDGDPYEEIKRLVSYARTWQIKEHVYRNGEKELLDPEKMAAILVNSGYRGFVPLETLPPSDPREKLEPFLEDMETALANHK